MHLEFASARRAVTFFGSRVLRVSCRTMTSRVSGLGLGLGVLKGSIRGPIRDSLRVLKKGGLETHQAQWYGSRASISHWVIHNSAHKAH